MQSTLNTLEMAAVVLQTLRDDDAMWTDFLDAKTMRVRYFLREKLRLTREAAVLTNQQAQLRRLLREHELSTQAIAGIVASELSARSVEDWESSVARWRDIARKHYQPRTLDACRDDMDAALKAINAFNWSTDKHTSGASFLGWREVRRVDQARSAFQYQFSKTFRGYDVITDHLNVAWDSYTSLAVFNKVLMGPHGRGDLEVLQQLGPNIVIIRAIERWSRIDVDAHSVCLVFRIKTERGFIQCVRSIDCRELMHEISSSRDVWPSHFQWLEWELLGGNDQGYKLRIGGNSGQIDLDYAAMWMVAAFGCVLRSEALATGQTLLTSP